MLSLPIALDFETYPISNEAVYPKPVCLSYYSPELGEGLLRTYDEMHQFLEKVLAPGTPPIIAHNASFELNIIDAHFPTLKKHLKNKDVICTKVYEQLLDNTRRYSGNKYDLASLVQKYFKTDITAGKKDPDAWRTRYNELDGVEVWPQEAIDYAIEDSIWAYKLHQAQIQEDQVDYTLSVRADYQLNKMGSYGLLTDKSRVEQLEKELLDIIVPRYKELEARGLVVFEKGKYKKKMGVLREFLESNVKNIEKTAKGVVATGKESLEKYLGSLSPDEEAFKVIEIFLVIMQYEKMLTAYVSRLKQANPLIRSSYRAAVSSGRTSSSSSKLYPSVNIQQMPRTVEGVTWDIRNCFVPRPGFKICSIDYAGLELASTANQLAELTGKTDMLDIINSGTRPVDMHSMLAYRIMNMKEGTTETYDSFVSRKKEPRYAAYRQLAKPINLGFPGGIGYETMRTLLAKDKIYPKLETFARAVRVGRGAWKITGNFETVEIAKARHKDIESILQTRVGILRREGRPVRMVRTGYEEYELVEDELVAFKMELFKLYPDLESFLNEGHKKYLSGNKKRVKNEFDEWEEEDMYKFEVGDFKRDWCSYTQVCNGLMMQSPAAIGAKSAMVKIMEVYGDSPVVRPLAFIHDEVVFEVTEERDLMENLISDVSDILIDEMQKVLKRARITVEAEVFDYWKKSGGFYDATYFKDPR